MTFLFNPAGCCCGCAWAEDDFARESLGDEWTAVSGAWELVDDAPGLDPPRIRSTAAGGAATFDRPGAPPDLAVEAQLILWDTSTTARLAVDFVDPDNYLYAELAHDRLAVGRRSGGVDTELDSVSLASAVARKLRLCLAGTTATATAFSFGQTVVGTAQGTTTAGAAGRKTGIVHQAGPDKLDAWAWRVARIDPERDECRCPASVENCCCGQWWGEPGEAEVDLTGLAGFLDDACAGCNELAAVWHLPWLGDCAWEWFDPEYCPFDAAAWCAGHPDCCGLGDFFELRLRLSVAEFVGSGGVQCRIKLEVQTEIAAAGPEGCTRPTTFSAWYEAEIPKTGSSPPCGVEQTLSKIVAGNPQGGMCAAGSWPEQIVVRLPPANAAGP